MEKVNKFQDGASQGRARQSPTNKHTADQFSGATQKSSGQSEHFQQKSKYKSAFQNFQTVQNVTIQHKPSLKVETGSVKMQVGRKIAFNEHSAPAVKEKPYADSTVKQTRAVGSQSVLNATGMPSGSG